MVNQNMWKIYDWLKPTKLSDKNKFVCFILLNELQIMWFLYLLTIVKSNKRSYIKHI
jgi:hypothetical protein